VSAPRGGREESSPGVFVILDFAYALRRRLSSAGTRRFTQSRTTETTPNPKSHNARLMTTRE
jgi:hypothetical protein